MGSCTTRARGRSRTTRGCAVSASTVGRSGARSTSARARCCTRRRAVTRLTQAIVELAATPPFAEIVGRLSCLRGVSTLTALALTVELGDWTRFRPQSLGPFLGLTPSEDSTGEKRRLGAITKTGNTHARRLPGRGRLAPATTTPSEHHARAAPPRAAGRGQVPSRPQRPPSPRPLARTRKPRQATHDRRGRRRPRARRPLLGTRNDGVATNRQRLGEESAPAQRREQRPAVELRAAPSGPRSTLDSGTAPHLAHRSCGTNPRISVATQTSTTADALPRRKQRPANSGPSIRARLTKLTPYQFQGVPEPEPQVTGSALSVVRWASALRTRRPSRKCSRVLGSSFSRVLRSGSSRALANCSRALLMSSGSETMVRRRSASSSWRSTKPARSSSPTSRLVVAGASATLVASSADGRADPPRRA